MVRPVLVQPCVPSVSPQSCSPLRPWPRVPWLRLRQRPPPPPNGPGTGSRRGPGRSHGRGQHVPLRQGVGVCRGDRRRADLHAHRVPAAAGAVRVHGRAARRGGRRAKAASRRRGGDRAADRERQLDVPGLGPAPATPGARVGDREPRLCARRQPLGAVGRPQAGGGAARALLEPGDLRPRAVRRRADPLRLPERLHGIRAISGGVRATVRLARCGVLGAQRAGPALRPWRSEPELPGRIGVVEGERSAGRPPGQPAGRGLRHRLHPRHGCLAELSEWPPVAGAPRIPGRSLRREGRRLDVVCPSRKPNQS
ncbi:MAG: hypothetical protein K0Q72_2189 [Armatimonadetes bacterium]|nr:hypothetical protein [Armatimonadota bacterium]